MQHFYKSVVRTCFAKKIGIVKVEPNTQACSPIYLDGIGNCSFGDKMCVCDCAFIDLKLKTILKSAAEFYAATQMHLSLSA